MNTPEENRKAQQEKNFPGYPSYPPSDDVTNQHDLVELGDLHKLNTKAFLDKTPEQRASEVPRPKNSDDTFDPDSDVSEEEAEILDSTDQNRDIAKPDWEKLQLDMTDEDGDPLNEYPEGYEQIGADLDVPGSESDDMNESIGEEDEENNYYSLGGDNSENLEEGH